MSSLCARIGLMALTCALTGCAGAPPAAPPRTDQTHASPSAGSTPASTSPSPSPIPSPSRIAKSHGPRPVAPSTPRRPAVTKVLVIVVENHSLDQMRATMPYTFGLARRFGYATHYTAIRHPSLPNYLAIAGGSTYGVGDDDPPAAHPVHGPSVFGQALASGHTAGLYADAMPSNCAEQPRGDYAVKHNPWAYFVDEHDECARFDVPGARLTGDLAAGRLPDVAMVIPDLCDDAHDCSLVAADDWFRRLMPRVFAGPDWRSGQLAVVLTADEDDHHQDNTVLTVVIHGSQHSHAVTTPLTHYSLAGLLSEVTGNPPLGAARTAPSLARAFDLPLGGVAASG